MDTRPKIYPAETTVSFVSSLRLKMVKICQLEEICIRVISASVQIKLTRSLLRTSILVPGNNLFSFTGDEYTRPSLFVAQRAQIQLE